MHNQRIAMDRQGILMKRALKETKKAADASADSAAIAQHTLEITQGAVIDIESITLRAPATNAGQEKHNSDVLMKCCIEIVFKNFGNTTAEDFYFEMRATAGNLTPDGIVAPYAIMGRPSPIFPKRTFKQESPNLMSMFLAIAAQGAVVGGKLGVEGFATYRDVFGKGFRINYDATFHPVFWEFEINRETVPDPQENKT